MDIEDSLGNAVCNVLTQTILGKRLDYKLFKKWLDSCLLGTFSKANPEAPSIYQALREAINSSESFQKFASQLYEDHDLKQDEICNEIMFTLM